MNYSIILSETWTDSPVRRSTLDDNWWAESDKGIPHSTRAHSHATRRHTDHANVNLMGGIKGLETVPVTPASHHHTSDTDHKWASSEENQKLTKHHNIENSLLKKIHTDGKTGLSSVEVFPPRFHGEDVSVPDVIPLIPQGELQEIPAFSRTSYLKVF